MGEARQVMDRVTAAVLDGDLDAITELYAVDALLVAPDAGELKGRDQVRQYYEGYVHGFSELRWEPIAEHETGNVAIDEGYFSGTNTGDLPGPTGETIPATGKKIRIRTCDVATVTNGLITSHHFYYDQMEFAEQLGLLPESDA